jgi:hypothetical protein
MFGFLQRMFHGGGLGTPWCSLVHDSPMWPIRQHYECRMFRRQYRVSWAEAERTDAHPAGVPSIARIRAGTGVGGVGQNVTVRVE